MIKRMEQVLSSRRGQINFVDHTVRWEMIRDITKDSVNCSSSAHCDNCKSWFTQRDAWKQHRKNPLKMLECQSNALFHGNLNFIFLSLLVQ